jgi:PAS domain-containing protein
MPQLSDRQASWYAAIAFLLTIALNWWMPGYPIILSGLLIVIFLSVFVPTRSSTVIASTVSLLMVLGFLLLSVSRQQGDSWTQYAFIAVMIGFTTLIVLYIKGLIRDMQFDKSHMTSLFENATEGIILTNSHAEIILVNPAATRMFGYEEEELIGKPVETLLPKNTAPATCSSATSFIIIPATAAWAPAAISTGSERTAATFRWR